MQRHTGSFEVECLRLFRPRRVSSLGDEGAFVKPGAGYQSSTGTCSVFLLGAMAICGIDAAVRRGRARD